MRLCQIDKKWSRGRRVIFRHAVRLFAKYGAAAVTQDDLARGYTLDEDPSEVEVAGTVSKALVRKCFKQKELLREIFISAWTGIYTQVKEIADGEGSPDQRLRHVLRKVPELLEEDLDAVAVLIRERYPDSGTRMRGCPQVRDTLATLYRLVAEIRDAGRLRAGVGKGRTIVHCLYGALEQGMLDAYLAYASPKSSRVRGIVDAHERVESLKQTLQAIVNGLLVDGSEAEDSVSHDPSSAKNRGSHIASPSTSKGPAQSRK